MKFELHLKILVILMLVGGMQSCMKKSVVEEFEESKFGYDYFPLALDKYWIYDVDSTIYDDGGATIIESSSQVREEIVEVYTDELGDEIHRIERFWRRNDSMKWKVTDVWVAYQNGKQAYRTEENLKFVKFVFPPSVGTRWNSNIHIDEATEVTIAGEILDMFNGWDDARIQTLDEPEELGDLAFDKVATILLTDDEMDNSIDRRYALEKYARGVGLIYKEYEILHSQCATCTGSWAEKAEKGFILKQTLIEHN